MAGTVPAVGGGREIRAAPQLDGVAMNAVLQPDRSPPATIRRILTGHLDSLRKPP